MWCLGPFFCCSNFLRGTLASKNRQGSYYGTTCFVLPPDIILPSPSRWQSRCIKCDFKQPSWTFWRTIWYEINNDVDTKKNVEFHLTKSVENKILFSYTDVILALEDRAERKRYMYHYYYPLYVIKQLYYIWSVVQSLKCYRVDENIILVHVM